MNLYMYWPSQHTILFILERDLIPGVVYLWVIICKAMIPEAVLQRHRYRV